MAKNTKCNHGKRKISCKQCKGSQICQHGRQRSSCIPCKGGSVCLHQKQVATCRICYPLGWAKRYVTISKQQAKRYSYAAPNITPEKVISLVLSSKTCCGCGGVLDWAKDSPCLHHNHQTGEVVGFTHRFCNTIEGFIVKLGNEKTLCLLKNFFPPLIKQIKASA